MRNSQIKPNKYINPYAKKDVGDMQEKVIAAFYARAQAQVEPLVVNVADLALIWTHPSRSPEHLSAWKTRLLREFPELHDAIENIVSDVTGKVSGAS